MNNASLFSQAVSLAGRFRRANAGNVAVIFSIAIVPIIGFIGAAVDYTRANNARTAMQTALDSAALMISQDAANLTAGQITTKAQGYFNSLYNHPELGTVTVTAAYTPNTGTGATIYMTGAGKMPTDFMKVAGYPSLDIGVSSTTTWGSTKLRIAMALDTTGSMADDGKLAAMKTSAKKLVDTLKAGARATDDVYLSIIPFNVMVNVGPANKNQSWLDWDTDYGSCSKSSLTVKSDCVAAGKTWTASGVNNWKGCVTDRQKDTNVNFDTKKDAPTTSDADTLFLAQNYSTCSSSILPMTSIKDSTESDTSTDDSTIKGKINNLVAAGNTNQAIGMFWAWMMLQPTLPFVTPAKDANYKYTDVIILLSDGMNTQDRWYSNATQIDARQKLLCDNIKNKAVNGPTSIYTIQVNTDGDPESAVLKYCGDGGQFYSSTTSSGISNAFASIGASLQKLRVAK
jgi:Flp pilus assembly protein TadG